MPDEEMEMTIDFSQAGFGEDIDIDLDFPAGQPDEDMDLGDIDRTHDIQTFNSDTRDELMAEGDDTSYSMVDAAEVDHNASAAPNNDIDTEFGQVEGIWQNSSHAADFDPDSEINYLDEVTGETVQLENGDMETGKWLPSVGTSVQGIDAVDHVIGVTVDVPIGESESHTQPPDDDHSLARGESPRPLGTSRDVENSPSPNDHSTENGQLGNVEKPHEEEATGVMTRVPENPSNVELNEHRATPSSAEPDSKAAGANLNQDDSYEGLEAHYPDEIVGLLKPNHADQSLTSPEPEQREHYIGTEPSDVKDDHAGALPPEAADQSADDTSRYQLGAESCYESTNEQTGLHDTASEYQLGAESYFESADDHVGVHVNAPQAEPSAPTSLNPQSVASSPDQNPEDYQHQELTGPVTESAMKAIDRDDPIALADHYGVYILYGETDYSLFANAQDDDPSQYFLSDKSALNLPLTQFLGSLREIVSDEISPLDELVMHVDGLGLEFSESTTLDFLGKFTFGDLVILYDKLVKNDGSDSSPPIYTYLTMTPNCNRRMMALGESANAGRGFSEVALYRDTPSVADWQGSEAESLHTDISIDELGELEELEEYEEHEERNEGDILSHGEQNLAPVTAETQSRHTPDQHEQTEELHNQLQENFEGHYDDSEDHGEDVSVPIQGNSPFISHCTFLCNRDSKCLCDDCYEAELQRLATPMLGQVWPDPGTVLPLHTNPECMTSMTNRNTTEDDTITKPSVLPSQETGEREQRLSSDVSEVGEPEAPAPATTAIAMNPSTDAPTSDNTSATVTLDGEDRDEIDYDSDEDEGSNHADPNESDIQKGALLGVSVVDEITWESDDDEPGKNDTKVVSPKDTVQVLPVSGKRPRSNSDAWDGAGDENDHKRRRS
ncbi:hypothetical protein GGR50DRAFT_687966 [Xylaria sp. CBS 124048]|nr:hypothetical protein GGR50DRAFT_687966 [Xylaria sp. CBS 124048]